MTQPPDDDNIEDAVIDDGAAVALPSATPAFPLTPDYTDDGVPTFDYVRDQIEGRFATSLGAAELAGETAPAASFDEQFEAREQAGKDRLEQIRKAMRKE